MTVERDPDRLDRHVAVPAADPEAHVQPPSLYGAIAGRIAVGRYVLQIGEQSGAVVREASRAERAHIRPRPTPILLRPRLIRGLLDRRMELAAALSALDAGLPIEVSGEPGVGKTAILRQLAHHPRAASFVDGIVYLAARHLSSDDLLQLIFEAFYDSDEICKPTDAEVRRGLQDKQALLLLDDVQLAQHELEQVIDIAPHSLFAVATRERCLWGEVRSIALKGLPVDDAVLLLEREIERAPDASEQSAARSLCASLEGHPLRIQQAAALIREQGISLDECARNIVPAGLMTELMASIDAKERRALLALTAVPGVPLQVQHVSSIADVPDVEPLLMTLVRRGLVVSGQSRHQLAEGVADQLRRSADLNPWMNRGITYFTAWAERYRRSPGNLLDESEALLRVQQAATDTRRWGEVLRLGRLLEGALVIGARWGAWTIALERCLAAAKAIGDRSSEAWALHEIGTLAVCLGEPGMARASLSQAVKLREAVREDGAAQASRRSLSLVIAPVSEASRDRATAPSEDVPDLDALPLRDEAPPTMRVRKTKNVSAVLVAASLVAIFGGIAYWARPARLSWTSWNAASISSFLQSVLGGATPTTAATAQRPQAAELRVLQFSAAPDRIARGESVRLCYEVANGAGIRIDPDIGDVAALRQNCVSATPTETTIYTLTAHDANAESVRQSLRVLVSPASSRASPLEEPGAGPSSSRSAATGGAELLNSPAVEAPASDRASILIFTSRPGSIAGRGPTRLCYAVRDASQVHVEPGIGEVDPTSTLTCVRVAPVRTTTYELTASGRDGQKVRQQLVIIVR